MTKLSAILKPAAIAAAFSLPASAAMSETLRLVTNWSSNLYAVERTLEFVEAFNASDAAKAADLEIVYMGGPEITPATEQLTGLSNGVFDMLFGSTGYYAGTVPEGRALYGTSITPMQARETGAIELLDRIYSEKANARVLGWTVAGIGYHLWLKEEPQLNADGQLDLSGVKVRSSGFYNPWIQHYGATSVTVPAPDIYNAMERGVVDGAAWPGLGITDYGWEKFIGYRVDPAVWQFDNLLWMNKDRFEGLSAEQQQVLMDAVRADEAAAYDYYAALRVEEDKAVAAAGVEPFRLSPEAEAAFIDHARGVQWEALKASGSAYYDELRTVLPPE